MTVTERPPRPEPPTGRRPGFFLGRRPPVRLTEVGDPEEVDLARHPRATLVLVGAVVLLAALVVLGLRSTFERSSAEAEAPRVVLPVLSVGGVGVVGTSTHFTGAATRTLIDSFLAELGEAKP